MENGGVALKNVNSTKFLQSFPKMLEKLVTTDTINVNGL